MNIKKLNEKMIKFLEYSSEESLNFRKKFNEMAFQVYENIIANFQSHYKRSGFDYMAKLGRMAERVTSNIEDASIELDSLINEYEYQLSFGEDSDIEKAKKDIEKFLFDPPFYKA